VALATRLLRERAREVRLAGPGHAGDQHVLVLGDPAARGELANLRAVEFALRRVVDVLEASASELELRFSQRLVESAVLAMQPLGIDKHSEALVEGQAVHVGLAMLFVPRAHHRFQAHGLELLDRRFLQHDSPQSQW